jgi:hypothetical protein
MPYGSVTLIPGINTEKTPTLNEAGISTSQLIRFRDGLAQKLGGWKQFYPFNVAAIPRELHAWQDLNEADHLAVGTTTQLAVITSGSLSDITPQTLTTNPAPNFTTTMNSPTVSVIDPGIANVTIYDSVLVNTPVSVGGIILSGVYPIVEITGTDAYNITAATAATSGVNNGGAVPEFTTTSGSAIVEVTLANHGMSVGDTVVFPLTTTGNGVTIAGAYEATAIVDANNFEIAVSTQATSSGSFYMNSQNAQLVYYLNIGPPPAGTGFGLGGFGTGGFGTGAIPGQQTGTEITATDWTTDNWGQILLACPAGGGVYSWTPNAGFSNAGLVATAPVFNGGLFVSQQQEILVCWASTVQEQIGIQQDPLLINFSTVGDYTNFVPLATDQAGDFRIPTGSKIVGGIAAPNQDLIFTDIDCWAMNYEGFPLTFGFNKIGAGAGLISSHGVTQLRGNVFWMGQSNFYVYNGSAVSVLPCPVWDFVFQNINTGSNPATGVPYVANVRAMPNTPFNEVGFAFPSMASSTGENDSYVKLNVSEPNTPWDYGALNRSAWMDQSVLGNPIGATSGGTIYQHETSADAAGQPLVASFTTGYFFIAEGEDYCFVDQILPDFVWGYFGQAQTAQVQLTFNIVNFPGDTPTSYGPYIVQQSTEILSVRFRGRQMSITVQSSGLGSFWRLGRIRYRFAPSGRR